VWVRPRGRSGLADGLATIRKAASVTQVDLAERLGINRSTVIDMEAGRNPVLTRYADALALLGFDVILVPRAAVVEVRESAAGVSAETLGVAEPR
jgi:DNA-binding XRE family transcriptional regulator